MIWLHLVTRARGVLIYHLRTGTTLQSQLPGNGGSYVQCVPNANKGHLSRDCGLDRCSRWCKRRERWPPPTCVEAWGALLHVISYWVPQLSCSPLSDFVSSTWGIRLRITILLLPKELSVSKENRMLLCPWKKYRVPQNLTTNRSGPEEALGPKSRDFGRARLNWEIG